MATYTSQLLNNATLSTDVVTSFTDNSIDINNTEEAKSYSGTIFKFTDKDGNVKEIKGPIYAEDLVLKQTLQLKGTYTLGNKKTDINDDSQTISSGTNLEQMFKELFTES